VYLSGEGGPKGKNLKEGDLEGQTKTDYEIGSDMDPGRAALNNFQNTNAMSTGGTGPIQKGIDGKTTYEALDSNDTA
jgi:hypothetical protein